MFRSLWSKWRESRNASLQLDTILAAADPEAPLADRNVWLIELVYWIRRDDAMGGKAAADRSRPEHVRLRYLLQVLERNAPLAVRFARTVCSVVRDNEPTNLLCDTGVASHPGFWGELVERLQSRLLPPPPNRSDLAALFTLVFVDGRDADWIEALDDDILARLGEVLRAETQAEGVEVQRMEPVGWDAYEHSLMTGIQVLASQVCATGLSLGIRSRMKGEVERAPFFLLAEAIGSLCEAGSDRETDGFAHRLHYTRGLLDGCSAAARHVYDELDESGVSVDVVFQVERMKLWLARIELLLAAWLEPARHRVPARLIAELVRSNQAHRSVRSLASSAFSQLARKVLERSAETGEHYITRDRKEYRDMVRAAAGGGLLTVWTVYVKFLIYGLHLDKFAEGVLSSMNYAGSFLAIQFCHFTLATKQPAMTGPALAHRLDEARGAEGREQFVDDAIAMIRSNAAAIVGNLAVVFPAALAVQWIATAWLGKDLITPEKAMATIESFSVLGPTPIYAAFTGVLLWLSSLFAGWADNWFVLHHVHDVLTYNRRLRYVFGESRTRALADFLRRNLSGIAANVSLGVLLGLGPEVLSFVGPHMEVRHVTLSAGSVGAALGVLGPQALNLASLWLAVAGIALMGCLNVAVSFALSFNMALRSRNLGRVDRRELSAAVRRRILKEPLALVVPPSDAASERS